MRLDLPAQLVLLVPVVLLEIVERLDLLGLLASPDLQVPMASLEPRESWARLDRRETQEPQDLRDPLVLPVLMDLLVFLDLKEPAVLRVLLVPLDSPELLAELVLLAPTVTLVLPVLLALLVKMDPRVFAETPDPQDDREMPDSGAPLVLRERRESLERTVCPELMDL